MKTPVSVAVMILLISALPFLVPRLSIIAQVSEQYRLENATILQDIETPIEGETVTQTDQGRNSRLGKEGFNALIGESPLRVSIKNTNGAFKKDLKGIGITNEMPVKIIYTETGGYAVYLGRRTGGQSNSIFTATGCTNGTIKCFTTHARPWVDASVYGFGYNIQGAGSMPDFITGDYFRPFSSITSLDPTGTLVAEGQGKEQVVTLKPRLNQARSTQGTFTDTVVITVLHDW